MKKKDLKRISNYIFNKVDQRKHKHKTQILSEEEIDDTYQWCEYNEEVTTKFKKLISNLLKYPNSLKIEIRGSNISIHVDDITSIKQSLPIKKSTSNSGYASKTAKYTEDDMLRIDINSHGFILNYGYRKITKYIDKNIHNDIVDANKYGKF